MTRVFIAIALFAVGTCGTREAPDAASDDAGTNTPATADAASDAAPAVADLWCTGRPVPEGLACVVQDVTTVGPCDGHGGVVFDGSECRVARGAACGSSERGGFDSLEECAVTCAAAGHCNLWGVRGPPEGPGVADHCGGALIECARVAAFTNLATFARPPRDCAVWGPLADGLASGSELPFPEQWDVMWSLTLVASYSYPVDCDPGP